MLFELAQIPAEQFGDLSAPRRKTGEAELTAEVTQRFRQRNPVAAFGGDARRFHACRTAADHQYLLA